MTSNNSINVSGRLRHLEGHYAHSVQAFRQQVAQVGPEHILIVLLDIGKNAHWVMAHNGAGQEWQQPTRLPTTQAGLRQFIEMTDALIAAQQPKLVILGHEPSGVYHEAWARTLWEHYAAHIEGKRRPQLLYRFFNPFQVKLARQQANLRRRKTDPRDLAAMLDLALRGLGQPAYLPSAGEHLVRQEVGFIRAQGRLLRQLEQQLRPQLDRLWPGAVVNLKQFTQAHPGLPQPTPIIQTRPLQRQRLRILLAHCPNPHDLLALSNRQQLTLYRENGGRAGPALLHRLRCWADNAVLLPPAISVPLAEQLQRAFAQYSHVETLIEEGRARLQPLVPLTPARHLVDIPGLSAYDAASYLAILGAAQRFQRPAEVWAFMGFDPVADGSGDHPDRVGHLSKRGDPAARDILYQMGFRTAQHYAPLSLTFLDAFERGLCEVEATIHTAHRLNRICFHLVSRDEPFENRSSPQLKAEKARRWTLFQAAKKRRRSRRKRRRHT